MGEDDPCCQYQGRLRAVPRPLLAATSGVVIRDRGSRSHTLVHVRFAPKADKSADVSLSPLSAISGHVRCSKPRATVPLTHPYTAK